MLDFASYVADTYVIDSGGSAMAEVVEKEVPIKGPPIRTWLNDYYDGYAVA